MRTVTGIIQRLVAIGIICGIAIPALGDDQYIDYTLSSPNSSLSYIIDATSGTFTNLGGGEETYEGPLISTTTTLDGATTTQYGGTADLYHASDCCFEFGGIKAAVWSYSSFPIYGLFAEGTYEQGGSPSAVNPVDFAGSFGYVPGVPMTLTIMEVAVPVPEPATWFLLFIGLFILVPVARQRRIRQEHVLRY